MRENDTRIPDHASVEGNSPTIQQSWDVKMPVTFASQQASAPVINKIKEHVKRIIPLVYLGFVRDYLLFLK